MPTRRRIFLDDRPTWSSLAIGLATEIIGLLLYLAAWALVLATFAVVGLLLCGAP